MFEFWIIISATGGAVVGTIATMLHAERLNGPLDWWR